MKERAASLHGAPSELPILKQRNGSDPVLIQSAIPWGVVCVVAWDHEDGRGKLVYWCGHANCRITILTLLEAT